MKMDDKMNCNEKLCMASQLREVDFVDNSVSEESATKK